MRDRLRTTPELAAPAETDYRLWERNVADHFKNKSDEEIKAQLQATANPFAVCFEHWTGDFNMGSGIRNANAFNAREVFYLGDKKWDRRAAVGVYNYTPVQWLSTMEEFEKLKDRYTIVGIDNVPGSISMKHYDWHPNTLLVFGEEGSGLTAGMQSLCKDVVHIDMFGSVRSFNCGVASGIVMHDVVRKLEERSNVPEHQVE